MEKEILRLEKMARSSEEWGRLLTLWKRAGVRDWLPRVPPDRMPRWDVLEPILSHVWSPCLCDFTETHQTQWDAVPYNNVGWSPPVVITHQVSKPLMWGVYHLRTMRLSHSLRADCTLNFEKAHISSPAIDLCCTTPYRSDRWNGVRTKRRYVLRIIGHDFVVHHCARTVETENGIEIPMEDLLKKPIQILPGPTATLWGEQVYKWANES